MTIDLAYVDERLVWWRKRIRWGRWVARAHIPVAFGCAIFDRWVSAAAFAVAAIGWELVARAGEKHVRWLMEWAAEIEMEEL